MHIRLKYVKKYTQKGDTIVEVLLSMATLSLVLGAAYATTTRSLRNGTEASDRSQALTYAQEQVEVIKAVSVANNTSRLDEYRASAGTRFCINPVTSEKVAVDAVTHICALPIGSPPPADPIPYGVYNQYDASTKTFTVVAEWDGENNRKNSSTLIYKPQNSFVTCAEADITYVCYPPPEEP